MRIVQNRKAAEKHYRRIEEFAPKTEVRLLRLTEKQYNNIYMVTGQMDYQEKRLVQIAILCYNLNIKRRHGREKLYLEENKLKVPRCRW